MTELSDALSADWQRRLRFPAWRQLVLSLSVMGAVIILTASYYSTSVTAAKRLEATTAADARLLAEALERDVARAGPLAVLAAEVAGRPSAARSAPLAQLAAGSSAAALALYAPVEAEADSDTGDAIPLMALASARGPDGAALSVDRLAELAGEAMATGSATASLPLPVDPSAATDADAPLRDGNRFLLAAARRVMLEGRIAVAVAALPPVAFEAAARRMAGEARVVSIPGEEASGPLADPRLERVAEQRQITLSSAIPDLGLAVTITRSTAPVRERATTVVSIEIMVMALLAALALYMDQRRTHRAYTALTGDAEALRDLNIRLSAEVEERRRVEAELRAAEAGLREAEKLAALGQMSAAVSHELSQPVAALRTYLAGLRLLMRQERAGEAAETLDHVDRIVERMTAITRELKALARRGGRADAGRSPVVDLPAAADAAVEGMRPLLAIAGVSVSIEAPGAPHHVRAERHRLEQVFSNLLQNALDALGPVENAGGRPRRIEIRVADEAGQVIVEVADSGPGIARGAKAHVFEPFFTTKIQGEGLGLGLAISAAIAAELGGRLELLPPRRYGPCRGARFRLVLPVAEEEEPADEPQLASAEGTG
ncbi:MAG: ATP-binding protein [Pseudomonadota bacterium]